MADLLEDAEEEALLHIQAKIGENLHVEEIKGEDVITEPARAEHLFSTVAKSWEEDELFKRFQHLMVEEKIFLQPKLTLNDVADMLESNTTYISKMVNNAYNLGFPELVNTLRIDYAEQYILNHKGAKQDEIATRCGFLSASSFNTIFKRITGVTPKIWVASAELQHQTRK
jgi:YesN/AraC family two-component response regulator